MVLLWCSAKPKWWVRVTVRIEAELLKRGWFAVEAVTLTWLAIEAVINSVRVVQITIEGLLPVKIPIITTGFMGKWLVRVMVVSISSKMSSVKPKAPVIRCVLAEMGQDLGCSLLGPYVVHVPTHGSTHHGLQKLRLLQHVLGETRVGWSEAEFWAW